MKPTERLLAKLIPTTLLVTAIVAATVGGLPGASASGRFIPTAASDALSALNYASWPAVGDGTLHMRCSTCPTLAGATVYAKGSDTYVCDWGGCNECVNFVKVMTRTTNRPSTDWRPSTYVSGGGAVRGQAIATFNGDHFSGHVAIFDSYFYGNGQLQGVTVWDQNWRSGIITWHPIWFKWGSNRADVSDAASYRIVALDT